jgi:hypothetical protein
VSAKYPDTELQDAMADTIATLTAERDAWEATWREEVAENHRRADEIMALRARAARLEEALREALYEVAWSRWMNGAKSDAEALERDAGFEEGVWHDAIKLQGAIDRVVEKRLAALAQEPQP